jgi:hypothetical protein
MPSAQGNGYYISHWVDECQEEEMRVGTETGSRPQITFVRVFFSSQYNPTISGSTARITRVFPDGHRYVKRPGPLRSALCRTNELYRFNDVRHMSASVLAGKIT